MEQVQLALDNSAEKPDVIYLTGGSARSPLIKKRWRPAAGYSDCRWR
jgi:hypothetical chaperone protein